MLDDAITRGWFMDEDDKPKWEVILKAALQIAQAMAFLHEEGIIFGSLNAYRYTDSCNERIRSWLKA